MMNLGRLTTLTILLAALSGVASAQTTDPVGFRRTKDSFPEHARGTRVAIGDVDGDGDPDVLISGRLLLNSDGKGTFRYVPKAGLNRFCRAAILLDYDRDGDLDVFTSGPDRMMRNDTKQGVVRFTDVSAAVGISDDGLPGEGLGAGDLNGDGYPAIYVANYELGGLARGTADKLYLSNGRGGYYLDSQVASRLCGRGVNMGDFDQDGDLDVFVSNYRLQGNLLYVNQLDQSRGYSLRAEERGISGGAAHTIGSVWGDLDGDGDIDMIMGNFSHRGGPYGIQPMVMVCLQSAGRFSSRWARDYGITWREPHSNPTLFDMDDDGDLDLYLTTTYGQSADVYRNRLVEDGALRFRNATTRVRGATYDAWGCGTLDVDNDGDQDLIVAVGGGRPPVLLRNERAQRMPKRQSVRLRLRGTTSDRWGAGATAILSGGGARRTVRQLNLGHGTSSQSEPILHFGVGKAQGPFQVEVRWPSGKISKLKIKSGGLYQVTEPKGPVVRPAPWASGSTSPTVPGWPTYPGR